MEIQQRFSLAKHEGPYEHWPVKTALLCDGLPTGTRIKGYVIEAQYRCEAGHLLITSFDCPYEESNNFTLLDDRFQVLATARLGAMYGSFLLNAHWPLDAHTLQLHYDMRRFYQLRIDPPGGLLRRRHRLRVARDDRAWPGEARALASVRDLETRLAAVTTGKAGRLAACFFNTLFSALRSLDCWAVQTPRRTQRLRASSPEPTALTKRA